MFVPWADRLGDDVELWPIQLPGRENRVGEPYPASVVEIADAIARDPALPFDGRFVLFGHSLGTIIAYEVAQRLRRSGRAQPERLIMSAHRAPHIPLSRLPTWNLPTPDFLRRLIELKGTPRQVFENDDLLALVLPRMRADLRLDETYRHSDIHAPLSCPITVFGGTQDVETAPEHLEAWRTVTAGPFGVRMFEGDHFFIQSNRASLIEAVAAVLRENDPTFFSRSEMQ